MASPVLLVSRSALAVPRPSDDHRKLDVDVGSGGAETIRAGVVCVFEHSLGPRLGEHVEERMREADRGWN